MRHSGTRKIQPNLALHCRTQLWIVRHPRDETLYLLLSWTGRHSPLQVWIEQYKAEQLYPYNIAINGNTRYVSLTTYTH